MALCPVVRRQARRLCGATRMEIPRVCRRAGQWGRGGAGAAGWDPVDLEHGAITREVVADIEQRLRAGTADAAALPPLPTPPDESGLLTVPAERLLEHEFFQAIYPEALRQSPGFRARFAAALVELRADYRKTVERRDQMTGQSVTDALRSGVIPDPNYVPKPGDLVANVGRAGLQGGYVVVPRGHAAYEEDEKLRMWAHGAIHMLSWLADQKEPQGGR
jgi:hypothetical protein